MDNAKIHQGKMLREAIEKVGNLFISLFSFSPIENFWSKVKDFLNKIKARTYKDLIEAIADAILQVSQQDIHNWFAHCIGIGIGEI